MIFVAKKYPIVWIQSLFIHSPVEGHLARVQVLVIVTNASVNAHVCNFLGVSACFDFCWANT